MSAGAGENVFQTRRSYHLAEATQIRERIVVLAVVGQVVQNTIIHESFLAV